ncbi:DUF1573 domain-containing protein [Pedobacter frigoris]|uniref:DUF1573 domain-containing protein n=1 Tax=Pedobacter frigoris TaxID=2571272 RepID=A0A4V5NYI2_9SPHI|nr:DUF1573 domain-containing protein [Pedobacter frigoris]TKC03968.1 DUF1573 domain-containing protein [Pedobacter frigoris]
MKKTLLLALAALTFASCQQNKSSETEAATTVASDSSSNVGAVAGAGDAVIAFETANYNFGKITQGEKVSYSYKFTNTGKGPLIITNAEASCGCTVPEVPKEPIKPGEDGEIKVVFNSDGKIGLQDKVITVTSNAVPSVTALHLTGEIKERQ